VIAVSYSGDTEETVSCLKDAVTRGCTPVCVASGGMVAAFAGERRLPCVRVPGGRQPRAALGLLAAPVLATLEAAGLSQPQEAAIRETAALLRAGNRGLGPDAMVPQADGGAAAPPWPSAWQLARRLHGRQTVVYGAGSTGAVARRWKGQLNENAEAPAYWNELPELDHNEIMAWTSLPDVSTSTVAVFLNDSQADTRLKRRAALTGRVLAELGVVVEQLVARGDSRLARLFSLVQLGDYVSFYLALLYGVDPSPVAAIQDFKAKLSTGA
jgi:glucose/mannose-6-phosphate isomerase